MEYIKLIDYLDKPELIQHTNGRVVRALHHFPEKDQNSKVLAVFEDGETNAYTEDGRFLAKEKQKFILKPKPKRTVTGWRKGVLWNDGCFDKSPMFRPTKAEFERMYAGCTLFGPWESETVEVEV
jgi:hypothetical protein